MRPDPPVTAQRLGDYRIVREIGRGGMGVVYEAVEESLGRTVALKMLPVQARYDHLDIQRFQREARAAGRLLHSNIVPVYGVGEHEGVPYYVMRYIAGQGLDRVLDDLCQRVHGPTPVEERSVKSLDDLTVWGHGKRRERNPVPDEAVVLPPAEEVRADTDLDHTAPVSPPSGLDLGPGAGRPYFRQVARIGLQVAEALAYAHCQGILHRDIKPSNLLIDAEGTVWVTDFGLAKAADGHDNLTCSGDVLGTLHYLAPERFSGKSDARSDVYSLGLTLFELLTLQTVFPNGDRSQLVHQILNTERRRPRAANPAVPRDLDTIVAKTIAREPERRYPSAGELAGDLRRWLEDRPIRARPVSRLEHAWRWCRRNPGMAGLLAALAGVLLGSILLVSRQWLAESRARADAERAAGRAQTEQGRAEGARRQAERLSANTALDLGVSLGDRGQTDRALLLMAQGLELATRSGDADLERVLRINLAAWRGQLVHQRAQLTYRSWVPAVAYSPDGRLLVAGGRDGTARLWDVATGQPVGAIMQHEIPVWAVAFRPDGKSVLTGTGDLQTGRGEVRRWEVPTGRPLGPPLFQGGVVGDLALSPDGHTVLAVASERAYLWRMETPAVRDPPVVLSQPKGVHAAALSPDGRYILTGGGDGTARLWDAASGRPVGAPMRHRDPARQVPGEDCLVAAVAFSPDGRLALTGTRVGIGLLSGEPPRHYLGGEVRRWRMPGGEPVGEPLPHHGPVWAVAFSPDGRRALTGGMLREGDPSSRRGEARQWDVDTGWPLGPPMIQPLPVWSVAFSPDGRLLLTGSEVGDAQLWNALTGLPLGPPLYGSGNAITVGFGPDGRTAAVGHATASGTVQLWEVPPGQGDALPLVHRDAVLALAYSADGSLLLTGSADGTARLWDVQAGRSHGPALTHPATVGVVAFSPDGKQILTADRAGTARLWDVATGRLLGRPLRHAERVVGVAFSPDGRLALTGSRDRTARLWDVVTGRPHGPPLPSDGPVTAVAFQPAGRLVAVGSEDGFVRLWDVATGKLCLRLGHEPIAALAFSPDGRLLVTAGARGTARLWDVASGRQLGPPLRHSGRVGVAVFSPNGRRVLTGGQDRTASLWDVATGQPLTPPWPHPAAVTGALFSPDGRVAATRCDDRAVRLWDTVTGQRLGPALAYPGPVTALAFRPGGERLAVGCGDGRVRFADVPTAAAGDADWLRRAAEALTGMTLTDKGAAHELNAAALVERRDELQRRGDPFFPAEKDP